MSKNMTNKKLHLLVNRMASVGSRESIISPDDKPTVFAHLGWRVAYTLVACLLLGKGVREGSGFFVSLLLFAFPLLLEYLRFQPKEKLRQWYRRICIIISACWVVVGIIGLTGVLEIYHFNNEFGVRVSYDYIVFPGFSFPLKYLWFTTLASVILTILDLWAYSSYPESVFKEQIQEGNLGVASSERGE